MRYFLPVLLLLLSFSAFSQIVNISGRCYYDVNGNDVFDGGDSVLANRQIDAYDTANATYSGITDAFGQYDLIVPVGAYAIRIIGRIADWDYNNIYQQHRDYITGGTDVLDFAYQQRDSITSVSSYIEGLNNTDIPNTGATRQFTLRYGYDGLLKNMPAIVTLNFNPRLTLVNTSVPPTVIKGGKLQWDFSNVPRSIFNTRSFDSINLTFNFPAAGDTISSFILSPKFIPGISVASPYDSNYVYDFYQSINFPLTQPIGATSGVKWLRHFAGSSLGYEDCISVDTTQNATGYFIAGQHARKIDSANSNYDLPFIAKLNKDGLSVWEKYLDSLPANNNFDFIKSIRHTPDGGCLVLGSLYLDDSTGFRPTKILIARFDSSGNYVWSKILSGSKLNDEGQDLLVLPDGSILITGICFSHDGDFLHNNSDTVNSNLFVTKLSSTGGIIFTKVYGGAKDDVGYRVKQLQNGSFLILGTTESNNGDVIGAHQHGVFEAHLTDTTYNSEAWVLNINGNGDIIWSKCYGGSGEGFLSGAQENNGGILLTGATNSKDGDLPYYPESAVSLWVLQISPAGSIVSSKLHKLYKGYQDSNYVTSPVDGLYNNNLTTHLHKTKDGNFVVGGNISDKYGAIKTKHGETDFLIVKINPAGDILWQKAIGGTQDEYINDIQLDNNDDILFVGNTYSGNDDLYQQANNYPAMVVGKAGITNIIKGQVFIDNNGNHLKDAGEQYYNQGRINSVKYSDTIVARIFGGKFLSNVDTGNYISTYQPANNYYTLYPATHATSFTGLDLKDSIDFALTPKPNINDLEVQLLPLSTPRPGFDATYRIITKNVGTTTINNAIIGLKKDSRQTYLGASRTKSGVLADSTWWGPFTLNAFDIDTLDVTLTLSTPPTLNNGDTLSIRVTANPVINDSSNANNVSGIKQIVRGSFDPNDKTEAHAGTLTTTQYASGEYLQYLIRFQNTGTDTAFFITVKDTLQSRLDPASMEIISTSHPYTLTMNGNVASWDFKKALLPDSTTNEAGSHGFILFKIKPTTGLTVGDEFTNHAAIYFDYNLPVITNQDRTVIGSRAGVCPATNVSFIAGISGGAYQWQVNTGTGFTNLANAGIYSGANTATLLLTAPPTSMYGYRYRCVINGITNSPESILKFSVRWNGTAGTAWENPANWDCGVLPDALTEVIIPAAVAFPLVSSNPSCYSLRLSPGSTVTVKTGFTLTITGKAN